jgi:endonuclease YncB( thermonuclease family)
LKRVSLVAAGFLVSSIFIVPFSAVALDLVEGPARIVDGDTVEIRGIKIRLEGIDAPETDQLCLDKQAQRWTCGIEARDRLIAHVRNESWACAISGLDRYGRSLGMCKVDGENVNGWMVANGWALSFTHYSHVYDKDETAARSERKGLWEGAFIAPWDWRARDVKTSILGLD